MEVSTDLAISVVTLAVAAAGLLILLGTAEHSRRGAAHPVAVEVEARPAAPDTMAFLMGRRPSLEADQASVLMALRPSALLTGTFRTATDSLTETVRRLVSRPSIMPTQGWLTSNFTRRRYHPLLHVVRPHEGIDVRAPAGTPIEAPAAGTVIKTGWDGGYGRVVEIDHGYGIVTRYAHTSTVLVRVGDRVQRGDLIAKVGRSGLAEAPHLHYEVHVSGRPVDPLQFVLPAVMAD